MKLILFIFTAVASIYLGKAQETLLVPVELSLHKKYQDKEALIARVENKLSANISGVLFYHRNDSTFIAYHYLASYTEFVFSSEREILPKDIISLSFIDNPGQEDLFVVKINIDKTHSTSLLSNCFQNALHCRIVNLKNHTLVFDFDIEKRFTEAKYIYAEDITNPKLSKEQYDSLFRNREKIVYGCMYQYTVGLDQKSLQLRSKSNTSKENSNCIPTLPQGNYELIDGAYKRK